MHPTWKRHSTPLHSPLRCHCFFTSLLPFLTFSHSPLLLLSPSHVARLLHRSFSFAPRFFSFLSLKMSFFSFTLPLSSPPLFVPVPISLFLFPFLSDLCCCFCPTYTLLFSFLLFSFSCSLVCLPFSLSDLTHTYLGFCLAIRPYANRFLGDYRQSC